MALGTSFTGDREGWDKAMAYANALSQVVSRRVLVRRELARKPSGLVWVWQVALLGPVG